MMIMARSLESSPESEAAFPGGRDKGEKADAVAKERGFSTIAAAKEGGAGAIISVITSTIGPIAKGEKGNHNLSREYIITR